MKKVLRLFLLALIFFPAARPIPTAAAQTKNPDAAQTKVRVILVFNEQSALVAAAAKQQLAENHQLADKQQLGEQQQLPLEQMERPQRLRTVIGSLRSAASQNQRLVLNRLNALQRPGKIERIQPLWIVNAIAVTAPADLLPELAALPGVASITPDYPITLTDPPVSPASETPGSSPAGLVPNLAQVNVSALWKMGFKGKGIVVANVDTGVSLDNPDLKARWRGGSNSWFDPHEQYNRPVDTNGHGSATMGIMVSSSYGLAPEAKWIAVKMFDDNLNANLSDALAGFQWLLDPDGNPETDDAPNVINNSWSENTPGCEDNPALHSALKALTAAGILPVFAAGNLGIFLDNGSLKKSTGPIPSIYPEVLAVGAVDVDSQIAPFSSIGPTSCRSAGQVFPDLVAPGVNITSSNINNSGYPAYGLSGTSFSAPHAAGALALILDAFPELTPRQQRAVLQQSARDLGKTGDDNIYGAGQLDLTNAHEFGSHLLGERLPYLSFLPMFRK